MQAIRGLLENGQFIPHEEIPLPRRVEVTVFFRENIQSLVQDDDREFWADFDRMTADSADENEILNDEAFSRRSSGREFVAFADEYKPQ